VVFAKHASLFGDTVCALWIVAPVVIAKRLDKGVKAMRNI
jgi:hypothetical protein